MPELLETVPATAAVPVPEVVDSPRRNRRAGLIAAAAVLVAVVGGTVALWNRKPAAAVPAASSAPARASVVTVPGRIAINAFPWANVTNIRNVATGAAVPAVSLVTPAAVEVPAGRYELTLSNPAFKQPVTRTVDVTSGAEIALNVQFADAAAAPLPEFLGGAR